jgi:hypothetical protein
LTGAADAWSKTADLLHTESASLRGEFADTGWTGDAADRFRQRLDGIADAATDAARRLIACAAAARDGAERIGVAQNRVLGELWEATAKGYRVSDDGAVSPPADPGPLLRALGGDDGAAAMAATRTEELTRELARLLELLGTADADTAAGLSAALDDARSPGETPTSETAFGDPTNEWPGMAQDRIAEQVAAMTDEQRHHLVASRPREVGNTDGVPWPMRMAANRISIADAILEERGTLSIGDADKVRTELAARFGPVIAELLCAATLADPVRRSDAVASYDRKAKQRIDFYQGLLAEVPDPTGRTNRPVDRKILAFDRARAELVELQGDLNRATALGVLVPGLNTTVLSSGANTETARRFVAAGEGDVAMITYLGGPFPTGSVPAGVIDAIDPGYALAMAPRLVAFSEDVNRTVDALSPGRPVPVTYIGHSYGGSILGTAEHLGLTADRTMYVEAAGAGVGVYQPDDWHNRNPAVQRYSMTAPGDPITLAQGLPLGTHGADPDNMEGVTRLATGRRLDGSLMSGLAAHSDVLDEPSDAWRNVLGVITGNPAMIKPAV